MFSSQLRYQTPPVLGKLSNIATKKDDQKGQVFIQWLQPTNINKIEHHLEVSYQTHQRHSPYSLCYLLEHQAL
jgi:hypothetical protein